MDLYSRKIVGWSIQNHMRKELVIESLQMAISRRSPPEGLMFHSDQGVQYASKDFQELVKEKKMIPSMNRKGNCWDNAPAESFFHSFKTEILGIDSRSSQREAKQKAVDYIEMYYNTKRLHSSLEYRSPTEYENEGERKLKTA